MEILKIENKGVILPLVIPLYVEIAIIVVIMLFLLHIIRPCYNVIHLHEKVYLYLIDFLKVFDTIHM